MSLALRGGGSVSIIFLSPAPEEERGQSAANSNLWTLPRNQTTHLLMMHTRALCLCPHVDLLRVATPNDSTWPNIPTPGDPSPCFYPFTWMTHLLQSTHLWIQLSGVFPEQGSHHHWMCSDHSETGLNNTWQPNEIGCWNNELNVRWGSLNNLLSKCLHNSLFKWLWFGYRHP